MMDPSPTLAAMGRAGRRAAYHLLQAVVEGLKAIEAVIEELGGVGDEKDDESSPGSTRQRIEIE
jgi:hypothetical protein